MNTISIQIRHYDDEDHDAVVALWNTLDPGGSGYNDPAVAVARKAAIGDGLFFVAETGGTVIGTVLGGYDGHRGWIYGLAVDPAYQRNGIGSALVHQIERLLRMRGCPKINLQVRAGNEAVIAFYERLGFAVEDRISMGKETGPANA
jgi:ribosomal protein S18 acetylase RimI-like enzyme